MNLSYDRSLANKQLASGRESVQIKRRRVEQGLGRVVFSNILSVPIPGNSTPLPSSRLTERERTCITGSEETVIPPPGPHCAFVLCA